jgi:hypothetical protein
MIFKVVDLVVDEHNEFAGTVPVHVAIIEFDAPASIGSYTAPTLAHPSLNDALREAFETNNLDQMEL